MPHKTPLHLVLASTSVYRKALMERLLLPFVAEKPRYDEAAARLAWDRTLGWFGRYLA